MRLSTIRTGPATRAAVLHDGAAIELEALSVDQLLTMPDWRRQAENPTGVEHDLATLDFAPLVSRASSVHCVGLNYAPHIAEMGRELPEFPTLFAKQSSVLIGSRDDVLLPA